MTDDIVDELMKRVIGESSYYDNLFFLAATEITNLRKECNDWRKVAEKYHKVLLKHLAYPARPTEVIQAMEAYEQAVCEETISQYERGD